MECKINFIDIELKKTFEELETSDERLHKEIEKAITTYNNYKSALGAHDFDLLQEMALTLLKIGAQSSDPSKQLTSIFG